MLSIQRLSLEDAHTLIEGASEKAAEIGVPMCISVVDESGNQIAFARMNGAKILSVSLSQDKAYTAAVSRFPTHVYNERCVPGSLTFGIHTSCDGHFSIVGGGLTIMADGAVVGGIGCSSGTPDQDRECSQAGIDAWMAEQG